MTRWPLLILAAVAALGRAQAAATIPSASITRAGAVMVKLPAAILASAEVKKHITSGLTAAFVVQVNAGDAKGGARVSVRQDLWEEKYLVTTLDATGREESYTFPTDEKLAEWWATAALLVMRARPPSAKMQVRLGVLPFSAREEAATREWLARAMTTMGSVKEAPVNKRSDAGAAKILDVIVGTSIQRRPILEYKWTIDARNEP